MSNDQIVFIVMFVLTLTFVTLNNYIDKKYDHRRQQDDESENK